MTAADHDAAKAGKAQERGTGERAAGWDAAIEAAAKACERFGQMAKRQGHDDAWPRDIAEYIRFTFIGRKDQE